MRSVRVAAAPPPLVTPPTPARVKAPKVEIDGARAGHESEQARKIDNKLSKLDKHLRKQFENFDAFQELDNMTLTFNDLELDGFEGADNLAKMFEKQQLKLKDLAKFQVELPSMATLVAEARLSEEEIDAIREQQEDAMREAAQAMEDIREELAESAQERRAAYEELREAEREQAAAIREWRREVREAQREREAELREIHREAEREIRQAELEWEHEHNTLLSEREMLEQREQSIRNAKESLELELADIERRRRELESSARAGNRR